MMREIVAIAVFGGLPAALVLLVMTGTRARKSAGGGKKGDGDSGVVWTTSFTSGESHDSGHHGGHDGGGHSGGFDGGGHGGH